MTIVFNLILVFLIGLVSAFVGSIVGAGGLISIPALIFLGLPPQITIATNKFGSIGLFVTSSTVYKKSKKLDLVLGLPIAIIVLIGAYLGAKTLLSIPNHVLEKAVGVIMLVILLLTLKSNNKGIKKSGPVTPLQKLIGYLAFLFVGFWGSFFGGGFGTLAIFTLLNFFGKTYLESAAIMNFSGIAIAIMSIYVYSSAGVINWLWGTSLLTGMILGGYLGARYGLKKGNLGVKKLFILVVLVSAVKLILA